MPLNERTQPRHGIAVALPGAIAALAIAAAAVALPADPPTRPIAPPATSPLAATVGAADDESESHAHRPIAPPGGSTFYDAAKTGAALITVLGLMLLLKRVLKRVGDPSARRPSGVVQVLARFPLAKGQQILLLEVGRRVLCVHQGGGAAATLCAFDDLTEIADLKARIEAGSPERAAFERELTRTIERSPSAAHAGAARPVVAETIDLTKNRRGAAARIARADLLRTYGGRA